MRDSWLQSFSAMRQPSRHSCPAQTGENIRITTRWTGFCSAAIHVAAILYKDRLVIALALRKDETDSWECMADISWTDNGVRRAHVISPDREFATREEALAFIEGLAKQWIDNRAGKK
jgi:hypothetical protein